MLTSSRESAGVVTWFGAGQWSANILSMLSANIQEVMASIIAKGGVLAQAPMRNAVPPDMLVCIISKRV